ncbi:ZIP family metal transporter [Nioella nitratireducens]|uniref:ZIP family metal transporter n=1 Tax=Nioella nitratireducens TaxID=1287720 RepID=UPI0008FD7566|nr:divalent cation transporter [Nioella nitratireducens]
MPQITDSLTLALLYSTLAGMAIPLGGFLAQIEHIRPRWMENELRHSVIAFGGGALVSGVALVLVPEGALHLAPGHSIALFGIGGIAFAGLDVMLARRGGGSSQLVAMLLDFLPESLALGALLATGSETALVLAGIIFLQNLPEGFNAYREITTVSRLRPRRVLLFFCLLVPIGPLAATLGHIVLVDAPGTLGGIMLFAAGGILYLVFEDIAPQAVLANRHAPPLGAVAGFMLGLAGHLTVG